jgi:hypothetical protein
MRVILSTAVLCAAWLPSPASRTGARTLTTTIPTTPRGGVALPAGWSIRADRGDPSGASVTPFGKDLHVVTGPAVILYRADTRGTGPFHTLATFTLTKPSAHAEGYGLFFGGQGLDGKDQRYTYFLVRQDGTYLIKRREGDKTTDVTKGWVQHAAVKKPDAKGSATNLLEIDHKGDPAKFAFLVNGQRVYAVDGKEMEADGGGTADQPQP